MVTQTLAVFLLEVGSDMLVYVSLYYCKDDVIGCFGVKLLVCPRLEEQMAPTLHDSTDLYCTKLN